MYLLIGKRYLLPNFLVALLLLSTLVYESYAQQTTINFSHLTTQHGLTNNSIKSIFQDKKGFLWFGTQEGLNRYDGYQFYTFKSNRNEVRGLSNNEINFIIEDSKGQLWLGTNNGLNLYQYAFGNFKSYINNSSSPQSAGRNFIYSLYTDVENNIWLGTKGGLSVFNISTKSFKNYTNPLASVSSIRCLYEYAPNKLLVGTEGSGIFLFNLITKRYEKFGKLDILNNSSISVITKDEQGKIWIGTYGDGLYVFDLHGNTIEKFLPKQHAAHFNNIYINSLWCSPDGSIWIGTESRGLYLLRPDNNLFIQFQNDIIDSRSLSEKAVQQIYQDNQNNLWVATIKGGLNKYSPHTSDFKHYSAKLKAGFLSYNNTQAFLEDSDGDILVGTDGGGLNIWNRRTNYFSQLRNNPKRTNSLSSDAIMDLLQDRKKRIWIGTWGGGLNLFNKSIGAFTSYLHKSSDSSSLSSVNVMRIVEDKNNILWLATYGEGINTFDPSTGKFKRLKSLENKKASFNGNKVVSAHQDIWSNLWFGTEDGGLNCVSADRKRIDHFFNKNLFDLTDAVRAIFTDSKKRLWVGKTGLYLYNHKTKHFKQYSQHPSLINERIKSISEDKEGNLWICTTNRLIKFNPETKHLRLFTSSDWLQVQEFNQNAILRTKKGELLFGGINGFYLLDPSQTSKNTYRSLPIYITDFKIFNKTINPASKNSALKTHITTAKEVTMTHKQTFFSFEYAALNYIAPEKTKYSYTLEGFDKAWNFVDGQRKATYTNVPPGVYTFKVKASSIDNIWNSKIASIKVVIIPPYWQKWWFKVVLTVLALLALFTALYQRRKMELKFFSEKKREELHQLQLQFFVNISHEFRTPLTLITGTLEQILKKDHSSVFTRHYHTINRNANRMIHLIGELMDFRKTENGSVRLQVMEANFGAFLQEVVHEFQQEAIIKQIEFNVQLNDMLQNVWFDRQIAEKILLNLLNNAFKYTTKDGSITIELLSSLDNFRPKYKHALNVISKFKGKSYVYISITDTGIGIPEKSINQLFDYYYRVSEHYPGSGIGLAFVKSLTLLHKGNISVYSEQHQGTQLLISIPSSRDDYGNNELWLNNLTGNSVMLESLEISGLATKTISRLARDPDNFQPSIQTKSILLVDDNAELRNFFKEVLAEDFKIIEAENGEEALLKISEEHPSLIISDVMMPLMDGVEFCKAVRSDFTTSHIPFILLTAKSGLKSRIEGLESGADYYFDKPVSTDLLILTIKNLFKQQDKLKDRYQKDYQMEAHELVHTEKDKKLLERLTKAIEDKLGEPDLNVEYLCQEIGTSKTQLYTKIKSITGQSIVEFIRTYRLKRAKQIMTHEDVRILEVMYRVGILSKAYFTTIFKEKFGLTPTQFQQQLDKKEFNKRKDRDSDHDK